MQVPDWVWKAGFRLLRLAIVGGVLLACLKFNYNGLDPRDILTVFLTLAGVDGFESTAKRFMKPEE